MLHETIKTKAVVIGEKELGEDDKLFYLYTKKFGKIEVLGKAIRKPQAKLKGGLQILNLINLEFVKGKNFNIVTDAILKEDFSEIKENPKLFRMALYISDILNKLVNGEEKDEEIWNLLLETLKKIKKNKPGSEWLFVRYFEWVLFSFLGFEPELYYCIECEKKINEGKIFFSAKDGGLIDAEHIQNKEKRGKEISRDIIKILRLIIHKDENILEKLKINNYQKEELKKITKYYLYYIIQEKVFVI
ncbi:MAG: DNA repair protein RecO [Candidatus Pacebacteria bacterium]|nr:DNA repair protein RecO [Candidatus Paceibacterota bacterium]